MIHRLGKAVIAAIVLLSLTACWNSKDIQTMDYATAIGLDYEDGKYITYVQFLNFTNVGRNESMQIGKPLPVWIAKGIGATLSESLSSIYATSQMRIFWGHVKTIVCSERLLRHGVEEAYNAANRFGEIRYNILVFGTREKLPDLFVQKSIFHLSPLDTIMFTPEQTFAQRSFIVPKTSNRIIAEITEPAEAVMLPSIAINRDVWQQDQKPETMLTIEGAFFFRNKKAIAWLSEDELAGTRWTQKELKRSLIRVPAEGKPKASLVLINPTYHVASKVINGQPVFDLSLRLDATLDELNENISIEKLERLGEETVRDEIMRSFRNGLAKQVDVLKLQETLYRNHPKQWHELRKNNKLLLSQDSIRKIVIKIDIRNTGKYKGRFD
ncbi:Ger(x)C family spore germination protein [Cohnella sp. LGH]|uniref:Ger(x)C family spore germination protein n=1 Tax=Cohnella sp. LGH TaxID=1619153 RepID=UPI001ADD4490|nr:Ger(x)C family spore germination protein [Cohnella sp. LGH]QTH45665.1 Ger(x)C family spore germination protein [Cohnella sp. LGH]